MSRILPKNIGFYVSNLSTAEYNEVVGLVNNAKIEETFIKDNPNHPDINLHQKNLANYINRINKLTFKASEYYEKKEAEYQQRMAREEQQRLRSEAEEMAERERFSTIMTERQRKAQIERAEMLKTSQKMEELVSYIKPIGIATGVVGLGIAGIGALAGIGYMIKKSVEEEKPKE